MRANQRELTYREAVLAYYALIGLQDRVKPEKINLEDLKRLAFSVGSFPPTTTELGDFVSLEPIPEMFKEEYKARLGEQICPEKLWSGLTILYGVSLNPDYLRETGLFETNDKINGLETKVRPAQNNIRMTDGGTLRRGNLGLFNAKDLEFLDSIDSIAWSQVVYALHQRWVKEGKPREIPAHFCVVQGVSLYDKHSVQLPSGEDQAPLRVKFYYGDARKIVPQQKPEIILEKPIRLNYNLFVVNQGL